MKVLIDGKLVELADKALDDIDRLFQALGANPIIMADWETMTLVPNNPASYPWDNGDRQPEDYESKEGKHGDE